MKSLVVYFSAEFGKTAETAKELAEKLSPYITGAEIKDARRVNGAEELGDWAE